MADDESGETVGGISRERLVEEFGEEHVQRTEWWSTEMERTRTVDDTIIAAIDDRDDVRVVGRGHSVGSDGVHTVRFRLEIAGEPFEYEPPEVDDDGE